MQPLWTKLQIIGIQHWKSKGHHYLIIPKFELDIYIIYCYDKSVNYEFHSSTCNLYEENSRNPCGPTYRQTEQHQSNLLWRGHNNYICIWNINLKYASLQKLAETEILYFIFFCKVQEAPLKNHQIRTKFRPNLYIPMTHPYSKFELNMCNGCWIMKRKWFSHFKGPNSVKSYRTGTKFTLNLNNYL